MGRRPRILIEGRVYHVYNRISRGEAVFRAAHEADRLVDRLRETKMRDEFRVLAWCVMPNHYHLAVRMGEVALSRSFRTVHQRVAQSYNGRKGLFGPLWQGRYRSKLVDSTEYLQQLVIYIHRNAVSAGLVSDAAEYPWCGHREAVMHRPRRGLLDVKEMLAAFEPTARAAMLRYRESMGARPRDWEGRQPGQLPWWNDRLEPTHSDEEIIEDSRPSAGFDGRGTHEPRPRVELEHLLGIGAPALGLKIDEVQSSRRSLTVVEAREVLAWVAVELYRHRVKDVAACLDKSVETTSAIVSRAARRRIEEQGFAAAIRRVDHAVVAAFGACATK
jgi:REP element-mobilizing transposase RayT